MQFVFERIDHILHLGLLLDDRRELLARFKNGLALRELIELLLVTDHFGIDVLKSFEVLELLIACVHAYLAHLVWGESLLANGFRGIPILRLINNHDT